MLLFSSVLALILSFCSFSYEFLIIKQMQEILGDGFIWRSFLVGVYVSFLGLGAFVQEKKKYKEKDLFFIEIILSSLGLLVPMLFYFSDNLASVILTVEKNTLNPFFHYNFLVIKDQLILYKLFFYSVAFIWTGLIGFFSGFEMPIIMDFEKIKTNYILSFNYWGSLLASIASSYIFTTIFDLDKVFMMVAIINIVFALIIQIKFKIKSFALIIPLLIIVVHVFCFRNIKEINQFYKFERINNEVEFKDIFIRKDSKIIKIEEKQTKYQMINKVFFEDGFAVFLDGHFQFDSVDEADYHETMVHVPLSLIKKDNPKILVLGGGDGLIVRELLKRENIKNITQIELDQVFFEYSKNDPDIRKLNKSSLGNKKLTVYFEDAFSFLRKHKQKYDFIIIDFPYPYSYDLAKLYSIEFYSLVYQSLDDDGYFVMDLPLFSKSFFKRKSTPEILRKSRQMNDILYSTIKEAKFDYTHFYMLGQLEGYVLASKKNKLIDWKNVPKDLNVKSIKSSDLSFMNNEVPHEYIKESVNSIFKPTIINFTDEINKY